MSKILFISNIANKIGSFSIASVNAAKVDGLDYYLAANWSNASKEQIREDEKKFGVHVIHIDLVRNPYSKQNIIAYRQLVDLIQTEHIDYIHCNTPVGGLLGRLVGNKCKVKKIIYQAHGFHFYKGAPIKNWLLYYPVERWLAHKTDALITINHEDYELAQKKLHLRNHGRVYYVPGVGIDLSQYSDAKDKRKTLRAEIGLTDTDIACISMGDLIPRKNYKTAIETIGKLKNSYPNLHYIICGRGQQLEELKKLTEDNGISDRIHFLGFRTDIKELLQAADIFFFTSLQEGLPRSTMEAMASGLPVACSRIRGNTDLIDEGKGGVLFDPQDIDEITEKLKSLLESDYVSMGRYNLDHINEFSLEKATEEVRKVYQAEFGGKCVRRTECADNQTSESVDDHTVDCVDRTENHAGGIALHEFYPNWYKKRLEIGLKASDIVLIAVGRLDVNKNNKVLVKAVAKLQKPGVHLVLCGDGEEKQMLSNLANELNIGGQVHFLGNRSDMRELYRMADIFLMASHREGLSRSIMEAMASGLPCIASRIRGNTDLLEDGVGGYLIDPQDVDGIADKICVLSTDRELREKMKQANLERIKGFDVKVVERRIQEIYREVLGLEE